MATERVKAIGTVLTDTEREKLFVVGVEDGVPYPVHLAVHGEAADGVEEHTILLTRREARGLSRLLMEATE